ncbi:hypothetical protein E2542_SST08632 [Spatholobus suberectus]|nr:hypothetical protein E2542_SST08632 [Spatholobus suberectus]
MDIFVDNLAFGNTNKYALNNLWVKRHKPLLGQIPPFSPQPTRYQQSFPVVVPFPRVGSYALLAHPPLETPLLVQLACVMHATNIHPKPGSNSP